MDHRPFSTIIWAIILLAQIIHCLPKIQFVDKDHYLIVSTVDQFTCPEGILGLQYPTDGSQIFVNVGRDPLYRRRVMQTYRALAEGNFERAISTSPTDEGQTALSIINNPGNSNKFKDYRLSNCTHLLLLALLDDGNSRSHLSVEQIMTGPTGSSPPPHIYLAPPGVLARMPAVQNNKVTVMRGGGGGVQKQSHLERGSLPLPVVQEQKSAKKNNFSSTAYSHAREYNAAKISAMSAHPPFSNSSTPITNSSRILLNPPFPSPNGRPRRRSHRNSARSRSAGYPVIRSSLNDTGHVAATSSKADEYTVASDHVIYSNKSNIFPSDIPPGQTDAEDSSAADFRHNVPLTGNSSRMSILEKRQSIIVQCHPSYIGITAESFDMMMSSFMRQLPETGVNFLAHDMHKQRAAIDAGANVTLVAYRTGLGNMTIQNLWPLTLATKNICFPDKPQRFLGLNNNEGMSASTPAADNSIHENQNDFAMPTFDFGLPSPSWSPANSEPLLPTISSRTLGMTVYLVNSHYSDSI